MNIERHTSKYGEFLISYGTLFYTNAPEYDRLLFKTLIFGFGNDKFLFATDHKLH